jgi:hypothetical protein
MNTSVTALPNFDIDVPMSEIVKVLSRPLRPHFPFARPYCRRCFRKPRFPSNVKPSNLNGNVGRPYYTCASCGQQGQNHHYHPPSQDHCRGWITWDDDRGICDSNPPCHCGVVSRQDRASVRSSRPGLGFWTCATGSCDYFSKFRNGWTDEERASSSPEPHCVEFVPWLL